MRSSGDYQGGDTSVLYSVSYLRNPRRVEYEGSDTVNWSPK